MPPVIAAAGAYLASVSITTIIVNMAISLVLSAVSKALSKPKNSNHGNATAEAQERQHIVRSSVSPHRIIYGRAVVSGTLVFVATSGPKKEYLHMVVAIAGHSCEAVDAVYFNDKSVGALDGSGNVTAGKYAGWARVNVHLGGADQAADAALVSEVPQWTSAHRLRGITYVALRLKWDDQQEVWPTGIPTPKFLVRGKNDIYDPRAETTGYTENAALCTLDYLVGEHGYGASLASDIDEATWIAAANVCDEAVALAAGGTEPRYTCNGSFTRDTQRRSVISGLLTAMGGEIVSHQGTWRGYAAAAGTATRPAFTEDDLRGPIRVRPRAERSNLFNAVRGTYIDPAAKYMPTDFPPITNATYKADDNGEEIWRDVEYPYTASAATSQRLAKLELELHRQAIVVDAPMKLTALNVAVHDIVPITIAQLGWSAKLFRVIGWQLSNDGGIDLVMREEAAAAYDWNSGLETAVDLAPNTELPSPDDVRAPTGATAASGNAQLFIAGDGTIKSKIRFEWLAPDDQFVVGYQAQYKQDGSATWIGLGTTPAGTTSVDITEAIDGELYDLRVRAINAIGVPSAWVPITHTVIGKTAPPPDVTAFLVQRQPDGTREFRWALTAPPADLAGYLVRYKLGTGHEWADMAPLHDGVLVSSPWETNLLAAGTYTAGIKAIDTSGNESASAMITQSTLGDPRISGALTARDWRQEGWPPDEVPLNGCHVEEASGDLVDNGVSTWDGLGDALQWDSTESWGNGAQVFTYYTPLIDMGADLTFTPLTAVTVLRGTPVIEYAYRTYAGTYGSPGYNVVTTPILARYLRARIKVTPDAGADDTRITQAYFIASGTVVEEDINDLDMTDAAFQASAEYLGVGDIRLPLTKSYAVITRVGIALQAVGAGWTWEIIDRSATSGPRIKVYNGTGALANATIDAAVKGTEGA